MNLNGGIRTGYGANPATYTFGRLLQNGAEIPFFIQFF
jgi:hypothetical protein